MAQVLIKRGDWNNTVIVGKTFAIMRGLRMGTKGPFLLVNGLGVDGYPQRNFRIFVRDPADYEITGDDAEAFMAVAPHGDPLRDSQYGSHLAGHNLFDLEAPLRNETDDEVRERIAERFAILSQMTRSIASGTVKGLVVWGASGVGKSYEVEAALDKDSLMDKLSFNEDADDQNPRRVDPNTHSFKPRYNFIKGYSTAPALYMTLYEYCEANEVLVFDDCDSIFGDENALNILKAALDTSQRRIISWRSASRNSTDAPNSYEFKGSIVFITNVNFERVVERGNARLTPHLQAIMSRCLCLDLTIDTVREKLIRIDHVARDQRMLELQFGLEGDQITDVLQYVHDNARRFRELSLRKVGQLATLRSSQKNWEQVANITLLRKR